MHLKQIAKAVEKFTVDNSPLLLTALGAAGTISSAVLAGKASYKAAEIIHEEERHLGEEIPTRDKVRLVWPLFIPPLVNATLSVTCIVAANRIGTRRAAAMATAYTITEKAFEEYRDKIVERLGPNKEREARDDIAGDRIRNSPVGRNEVIVTGQGDVLCHDEYTGRYFKSSMQAIRKAENDLNQELLSYGYASLNAFYSKIGLANVPMGEEVGWNSDKLLDIHVGSHVSDDDVPCLSIEFRVSPIRNYFRTH